MPAPIKVSLSAETISHGPGRLSATILPRRASHHSLESSAECAFGFIAERQGDTGDCFSRVRQSVTCEKHAPARQIIHRGKPDLFLEVKSKTRPGHRGPFSQRLQGPLAGRIGVHRTDSRTDPPVGKREKPADAARIRRCDMEAQYLHALEGPPEMAASFF